MASWVFEQVLPVILTTTSPRAWAFTLIGIHEYLRRFAGDRMVNQVRDDLAGRLLTLYQHSRSDEWRWYEDGLTYCNAALPQAMLMCGQWIPNNAMAKVGLESLNWLTDLQHTDADEGHFVPIGSNGFYQRGGERAASINNQWKRKAWSPPASRPTGVRETHAGAKKPDAPLSGSSGAMT
jgi:hypothetical protein